MLGKLFLDLLISTGLFIILIMIVWYAMFTLHFGQQRLHHLTELLRHHPCSLSTEDRQGVYALKHFSDRRRHNAKRIYLVLLSTVTMKTLSEFHPDVIGVKMAFCFCLVFTFGVACALLLRRLVSLIQVWDGRDAEQLREMKALSHGWKRDILFTATYTALSYFAAMIVL